jgi:hypothetical protein
VVDACEVVDLIADAARGRVTGVRTRRRNTGGAEEVVEADLVLDATGRGSRASAWLSSLGYEPPREEQLTVNLGYVTRQFRLRPGSLDAKMVAVGGTPARPTGFILLAQEDDTWILTLFGYEGAHPPMDPDAVLDLVKTLAPADVFAAVRAVAPAPARVRGPRTVAQPGSRRSIHCLIASGSFDVRV